MTRLFLLLSILAASGSVFSAGGLMCVALWIIATAATHPSLAVLQVAIVGVRFFGLTRASFRYLERLASHESAFRISATRRANFLEAIIPATPEKISAEHRSHLVQRIVADMSYIEQNFPRFLLPAITVLFSSFMLAGIFAIFEMPISSTVKLLGTLCLCALCTVFFIHAQNRELTYSREYFAAQVSDFLLGFRDLTAFGRCADKEQSLNRAHATLEHRRSQLQFSSTISIIIVAPLVAFTVQQFLMQHLEQLTPLATTPIWIAALSMGFLALIEPMTAFMSALPHGIGSRAATQRLNSFLKSTTKKETPHQAKRTSGKNQIRMLHHFSISFCEVALKERGLNSVSFHVPAGGIAAFVGASGTGKTTLNHLVMRFCEPDSGDILLGDESILQMSREQIAEFVTFVQQREAFFSGTIRENLCLAAPAASDAEMWQALEIACLSNFIANLPKQLETNLGTEGLHLSAGEKQRLALARALLRNTKLLIIDEISAHLDFETTKKVISNLCQLSGKRTILMTSHQVTPLEPISQILVLANGAICEQGSYALLKQNDDRFSNMIALETEQNYRSNSSPNCHVNPSCAKRP